jgi:hypothetical protein
LLHKQLNKYRSDMAHVSRVPAALCVSFHFRTVIAAKLRDEYDFKLAHIGEVPSGIMRFSPAISINIDSFEGLEESRIEPSTDDRIAGSNEHFGKQDALHRRRI